MQKFPYETEYWDFKQKQFFLIYFSCPYPSFKKLDEDGEKRCIFHSTRDDKNVVIFYQDFKEFYEKGENIFPKEFDFVRLKRETGVLEFKDTNFRKVTFSGETNFTSPDK